MRVDQAAAARDELSKPLLGPGQPLAIALRADPEQRGPVGAVDLEHGAEQQGHALLTVEAEQHAVEAGELDAGVGAGFVELALDARARANLDELLLDRLERDLGLLAAALLAIELGG